MAMNTIELDKHPELFASSAALLEFCERLRTKAPTMLLRRGELIGMLVPHDFIEQLTESTETKHEPGPS